MNEFDPYGISYPSVYEGRDLYVSASEYGNSIRCINHTATPNARFVPMYSSIQPRFAFPVTMKFSTALIAVALVYLLSLVTADHLMAADKDDQPMTTPSGLHGGVITNTINAKNNNILVKNSRIVFSKADRVQLAKKIKEMMAKSPEAGPASAMTTEDLFGFLSGLASNPAVLSNAADIISSAASGNTPALAGHVVGLLGAALPPATPAPDVETPAPVAPATPMYAVPTAAASPELPSTSA
ncbi:hypothetical protein PInf_024184 [Phytophthora infestans]|nr:hypothetical protein PInf_024184 [Phytophthora infestans]